VLDSDIGTLHSVDPEDLGSRDLACTVRVCTGSSNCSTGKTYLF